MARYVYKAVDGAGKTVPGSVEAQSIDHANELISGRGLLAMHVREEQATETARPGSGWSAKFGSVHPEEIILFTKQLSTMLRAGIPVLRTFDILENQTENDRLKMVCRDVATEIRSGSNIHRALRRHPKVFSPLYCSMVEAGEASGALPSLLQRLIYVMSHDYKIKSDIRSVMQYPIIVLVALVAAFLLLVTMVIPRFATMFERSDVALPLPTRICLGLHVILQNHALAVVLILFGIALALYMALKTEQGRYWRDRLLLSIPLIGPLMVKAALSRLASIFSIMQNAAMGILDSVEMLSETIGNVAIGKELLKLQVRLEEGHGIARPLSSLKYFTPMFVNMVAIGEEAGNLEEMLKEIAVHYDAEVEYATRRMTTAMGPILLVLLAALVGFFALAVYMPMWDLAKVVTK